MKMIRTPFVSSPKICRDFVRGKCTRTVCKFSHEISAEGRQVAKQAKRPNVVQGTTEPAKHQKDQKRPKNNRPYKRHHKVKNTETFEPLNKPVDMRIVIDLGKEKLTQSITSRDVLLVPNLFSDFLPGYLYNLLEHEIQHCGVPQDQLLKLWHGDSHWIADDHTGWKKDAHSFNMIINRIRTYFNMDIKATRFNWYKDTSEWKPMHFDAAAVDERKAHTQNFTVAVSFGATRDAAFENAETKTVISMPQPDGTIYAFAKDTNVLWRHGILKEKEVRPEGRISIIAWGWINQSETEHKAE